LPAGVRARIARCPMPNAGVVSMVVSPAARRRNLLLCAFRSLSSVVQDWPDAGTNCRSSVQIRHASGGASEGGYWVPQALQMKAVMRGGYTVPRSRASVVPVRARRNLPRWLFIDWSASGTKRTSLSAPLTISKGDCGAWACSSEPRGGDSLEFAFQSRDAAAKLLFAEFHKCTCRLFG
jgi:hypothetical protein